MKKWKCMVCGYIHEGETPPDECPICGADRSQFVEWITDEEKVPKQPEPAPKASGPEKKSKAPEPFEKYKFLTDAMAKFHAHPIAVHIPNGVLPAAVFFLFMSFLFHHQSFETAAFFNLVFVVISMPGVILTGFVGWKIQYKGALTHVFKVKILCAVVVSVTGLVLVLWKFANPDVTAYGSSSRWLFMFILILMLGAAATAGYFGGKLVFRKQ